MNLMNTPNASGNADPLELLDTLLDATFLFRFFYNLFNLQFGIFHQSLLT
jgi:hypothetical protein